MTQSPGQWPDPYQPPAPPPSAPPASPTYPAYQTPPAPPYGYGTPGYGTPGYGTPGYGAPTRPTNAMALASMIVALAGIISGLGFPIGAILGHIALKQVRETGEQGESYAKAGIIIGWIGTALMVLGCVGYVVFLAAIFSNVPSSGF